MSEKDGQVKPQEARAAIEKKAAAAGKDLPAAAKRATSKTVEERS